MADEKGLGGIALTDHDTLDGIHDFLNCDASEDLLRVPGVEISTEYLELEAHILGYYIPYGASSLKTQLRVLEKSRKERLPKMVKRLEEIGIDVDQERLDEILTGVGTPGRPHLARMLVESGVVESWQDAFDKYLAAGRPAYVKKERMNSIQAIELIRRLGGIPVLAHPLTVRTENLRGFVEDLVGAGLGGLEAAYDYGHLKITTDLRVVEQIADEMKLLKTGGSDFHGDPSHAELGEVTVAVGVIERLKEGRIEHESD
jgi:predicted metal-dependent phosphoesterase TrpH